MLAQTEVQNSTVCYLAQCNVISKLDFAQSMYLWLGSRNTVLHNLKLKILYNPRLVICTI